MIVVGDTGPLNYLLLIGHVDVLPSLQLFETGSRVRRHGSTFNPIRQTTEH